MKFICLQENLKENLMILERIASKNKNLPILHNILLKTEEGSLKAFATDLEIGITIHIPCKIEKQGEVVLPIKLLSQFIQNLSNVKIQFEKKNNAFSIDAEHIHTTIPIFNVQEFPLIPKIKKTDCIEINGMSLKNGLQQVLNSIAISHSIPEITGILFDIKTDYLKIVSTDSFRLSEKIIFKEKNYNVIKNTTFILPQKTAQELVRIINNNEIISLYIEDGGIIIRLQNSDITSRLITGQYPYYEQIIPKSSTTTIALNKNEFISHIKLASIFSSQINDVKIKASVCKKTIEVIASDKGKGEFSSCMNVLEIIGEDVEAVFNFKYLLDGLANISDEEIVYELNGSSLASILKTKNNDYRYIIMPIKL